MVQFSPLEYRRKNRRELIKKSVVAVASVTFALLAGELAVRAFDLAPEIYLAQRGRFRLSENPLLGYETVPHFKSETDGPFFDYAGRSNSLGFRDREHPVVKPEGVQRILVLGDSITQGYMVTEAEDIFTAVLERRLQNTGRDVEVLNFGVNGYDSRQQIETLREHGLAFAPDLVVVAYCINDNYIDSGGIHATLLLEKERHREHFRLPAALTKSALGRLIWTYLYHRGIPPADVPSTVPTNISHELVPAAFADLRSMADDGGFQVLVAIFPELNNLKVGLKQPWVPEVEEIAAAAGFTTYDLTEDLLACDLERSVVFDTLHPNAYGHACVGEALARSLLE